MIQLDFDAPDATAALAVSPTEVGYSQHDGAEAADWDASKLEKVGGTHPVVYPAEGSHANDYGPALYLGSSPTEGVGCDNTRGPWRELRPAVKLVPDDRAAMVAEYPWLGFAGNWGEKHAAFYNGPTGPNAHSQWTPDHVGGHPMASVCVRRTRRPHGRAADDGHLLRRRRRRLEPPDVRGAWRAAGVSGDAWGAAPPALGGGANAVATVAAVRARPPQSARADPARVGSGLPRQPAPLPHDRGALRPGLGCRRRHPAAPLAPDPTRGALGRHRGDERRRGRDGAGHRACPDAARPDDRAGDGGIVAAAAESERELLPRTAYATITQRIQPIITGLVVVAAVIVVLQLTVVGIPVAVWLLVRWSLFTQCIVLENLSWRAGLRRSHQLVRGHWFHVAWVTLAVVGFALLLGPLIGIVLLLATPMSLAAVNLVSGVVYVLTIPYAALATTYVYYDLRVRERSEREPLVLPAEAVLD